MITPETPHSKRGLVLLAAFLGWMFDGLEMGVFPLVARPALQQMQATAGEVSASYVGTWNGIITALFLLGAAAGGLAFGWLGDRIGRVRAMTFSILTYSIFTGLIYFAQTPLQLGGLRFVAALGMGGEWSLGVALVMEVWSEKHRPMLAAWIGAAGNLGFFLSALVGLSFSVTQDTWRWVMLIGTCPALLTFFIRLYVPESPRWQQAAQHSTHRPVREIFTPPLLKMTIIASCLSGIVLIGTWGIVQWLPLWADQLAGSTLPKAKAYTQACSALGAMVFCFFGAWLGHRCGRRLAYFILCLASLILCAIFFDGVTEYGGFFLVMTFLVGGITAAFYGWLPLYLPELFPTRARATAQGFAYNAGRVLAAVGALQMGALMQQFHNSYSRAAAVLSLIYGLGLVLIWFAPETKSKPLPE